jgi:menaquinone-dependent protoporphyrinogen IX oxidase
VNFLDGKTLIAYTTKSGATKKTAKKIADVLQTDGLQVDLVNLAKQSPPNLDLYNNIVVGSGVQKGKIYPETKAFLAKDFSGKKLAYFTCSGFIYPKTHDETLARYATAELANYPNFKPVATEAFGGYLKILGLHVSRKMDMAKVEAWAQELNKKFSA